MKKIFPLKQPGKVDARVVESVKNEVRKYVSRERRKDLPEGFNLWTFDCKVGATRETPEACELAEVTKRIDAVVNAGGAEVYVEIVAQPGKRAIPTPEPAAE